MGGATGGLVSRLSSVGGVGSLRRRTQWLAAAAVITLPLLWLATQTRVYFPFIADDALISLRYSARLLEGEGLTWTDGEAVEGYSNLLWVLGCSLLGALGIDLIDAARILGVVCVGLVLWAGFLLVHRKAWPALLAALVLASTGPVAVWAIGGLEQPLFAALLLLAFAALAPLLEEGGAGDQPQARSRALRSGLAFGLLCWTRPDAPIFVAVAAATLLGAFRFRRRGWLQAFHVCAVPGAMVLAQLAFRLAYYGDWVPNTAHVKGELSAARLREGLQYLEGAAQSLSAVGLLSLLGVYAAVFHGHRRRLTALCGLSLLAWCAYVAAIGGDIFPAYRHLVVAVALCFALIAIGFEWLCERGLPGVAIGLPVLAFLPLLRSAQLHDPQNDRARAERWEWESQVIGELFREGFAEQQPYLAVTAAGGLPYFSGLPSLDMQGLCDRHIALAPPGRGFLGHDHGDGAYVLERQPDLIAFRGPGRGPPAFVSGRQMERDPRFTRGYQLVRFLGYEPFRAESRTWVRLRGRVGIAEGRSGARVPAYLLEGKVVGHRTAAGSLGALLQPGRARSPEVELPAGTYRVSWQPPGAAIGVSLQPTRGEFGRAGDRAVSATSPFRARLIVEVRGAATELSALSLERTGPAEAAADPPGGEPLLMALPPPGQSSPPKAVEALEQWRLQGRVFRRTRGGLSSRGRAGRGSAVGPSFRPSTGDVLVVRLRGGSSGPGLGLSLASTERRILTWGGKGNDEERVARFDLAGYEGEELRLQLEDRVGGPHGYLELLGASVQPREPFPANLP